MIKTCLVCGKKIIRKYTDIHDWHCTEGCGAYMFYDQNLGKTHIHFGTDLFNPNLLDDGVLIVMKDLE